MPGLAGMGQKTGVQRTQRAGMGQTRGGKRLGRAVLHAVLGRIKIPPRTFCSLRSVSELSVLDCSVWMLATPRSVATAKSHQGQANTIQHFARPSQHFARLRNHYKRLQPALYKEDPKASGSTVHEHICCSDC